MFSLFKEILCCPFCFSPFKDSDYGMVEEHGGYGILYCNCGAFPVVDGIPIILKGRVSATGIQVDYIIELLRSKKFKEAITALILPPPPKYPDLSNRFLRSLPEMKGINRLKRQSHNIGLKRWREKLEALFFQPHKDITALDYFDVYFRQSGLKAYNAYDYFAFRFGQPRHLVALGLNSIISENNRPILELGCGFGHITYGLLNGKPKQPVVGVDNAFFTLYGAKKWIAPNAQYICADVDVTLPFSNSIFSAVIYVDGIHYVRQKYGCIRESQRVSLEDGIIIFASSRNRLFNRPYTGNPLSPEGYYHLIKDFNYCLISDTEILDRYLNKLKPNLEKSTPLHLLSSEELLSIIISNKNDYFVDHGKLEFWPHAIGSLTVNPLYKQADGIGIDGVFLNRIFPSSFYEDENLDCKKYLPESVTIDSSLLANLPYVKYTDDLEELLKNCVLLGIPDRYLR